MVDNVSLFLPIYFSYFSVDVRENTTSMKTNFNLIYKTECSNFNFLDNIRSSKFHLEDFKVLL